MDLNQINFHVIQQVDSTNKYAMEKVSEGLANHMEAWFAIEQTDGKGQRSKNWQSNPGENITFSVVIRPQHSLQKNPFLFNALIALVCRDFLSQQLKIDVKIKWPNDLFINDKKAGGILIENRFSGENWKWAVVGIGINVNQVEFPEQLKLATSIKKETKINYDPLTLAKLLHQDLIYSFEKTTYLNETKIWKRYNEHLFKKGQHCRFKIKGIETDATINHVNNKGLMVLIQNDKEIMYHSGEIEWIL
jgi:BirA family biotin operon repressor/biotin-[acetyl-CoA-carboxylase] ligase